MLFFRNSLIVTALCLSLVIPLTGRSATDSFPGRLTSATPVSGKLSGTIIGTDTYVDYSTGDSSKTVNTLDAVFDGNYATYLATYKRSGTWVGLDLGKPCVITAIGYSPRIGQPSRVQLAVIEGANNADFSDAVPLYLIPSAAPESKMTYATLTCTKGFRYVRYITPNDCRCNLSELAFFGYGGTGTDSVYYQPTNLPVAVINTANHIDVTSKEDYLNGTVSLISGNGQTHFTSSLSIKGRGNMSWTFPKKPYRIKLEKATQLLDFPAKAKNWTLINNYGDKTLMRNLIAFDISRKFKMAYTPAGRPVDVILNGEYKGCYQLCDQIDVRPNRVDVEVMSPDDIAMPNLGGGYLIEVDAYANTETKWFTSKFLQIPVTIHYPDDDVITSQQTVYIKQVFDSLETVLFSSFYRNQQLGYRSRLDLTSFLRHFIIGELCGNTDTYFSTYLYKKRNDIHLFTGPVWDFDIALENDCRTYPINNLSDYVYCTTGSSANGMRTFAGRILNDPGAVAELKAIWSAARRSCGIDADTLCAEIDAKASELNQSQELNFVRWPIMDSFVHMNPRVLGSYVAEVDGVKTYLRERIAWLDTKLQYVPLSVKEIPSLSEGIICASSSAIILDGFAAGCRADIYSMMGKLISSRLLSTGYEEMSVPKGLYCVRISQNGQVTRTCKLAVD